MTVDKAGAETVLSLRGDLDIYTASRLREQLLDLVNDARPNLVIDLTELFFVDSTGLGTLVDGMKRVRQAGGSMTLRSPNAPTRRAIEVSGLARILPIRD